MYKLERKNMHVNENQRLSNESKGNDFLLMFINLIVYIGNISSR